ncbi:ComF family protein [Oxalobacteraceae bacterium R-40]|uniref:ComF family protein n=1 Tax=Keguizhuia sedimenti TaxID=3064264 RepID=A0ABU1BJ82_9BURK|nr:ComF family protein [Oxalobacteraceae bacterium R-40]
MSHRGAGENICGACLHRSPSFDATVAAVDYAPPTDQLVLALKFGAQLAFAKLFGEMVHAAIRQTQIEMPQVLIAVPLGPKRLAERGFNQALEIAKPLARKLRIPLDKRLVLRTRETAAQALLPPEERRQNIRRAFTLSGQSIDRLKGLHVGVVDDVMTTGETLNELAATLKRFGARRVTNLVFARTLK